ncbi:Uncharacterised protein [uncultured archaeon]|nr:Uncharacterised protein [uncultured archaeon]
MATLPSALSGRPVQVPDIDFYAPLNGHVLEMQESLKYGEKALGAEEARSLRMSNASNVLSPIRLTSPEVVWGENVGAVGCASYGPTTHCYKSTFCYWAKHNAYSFWPKWSEYVYGCSNVLRSMFCIRCFQGVGLSRCLECSDCVRCEDCYFSHNLENCSNCLFCFNTKAKRYAIFNREVGKEEYMRVKKRLLDSMADELEKTHALRATIFNLGASP